MTDKAGILLVIYAALGLGLLGEAPRWSTRAWAWYCTLFPLHLVLFSLTKEVWSLLRPRESWGQAVMRPAPSEALCGYATRQTKSGSLSGCTPMTMRCAFRRVKP